jgi:hypothetical protein
VNLILQLSKQSSINSAKSKISLEIRNPLETGCLSPASNLSSWGPSRVDLGTQPTSVGDLHNLVPRNIITSSSDSGDSRVTLEQNGLCRWPLCDSDQDPTNQIGTLCTSTTKIKLNSTGYRPNNRCFKFRYYSILLEQQSNLQQCMGLI